MTEIFQWEIDVSLPGTDAGAPPPSEDAGSGTIDAGDEGGGGSTDAGTPEQVDASGAKDAGRPVSADASTVRMRPVARGRRLRAERVSIVAAVPSEDRRTAKHSSCQ